MIPELHFPWLELSILLPLIGAIACAILPSQEAARRVAIAVSGLTLLFTLGEWYDFSTMNAFQAHDHWDMIQWLFGHDYFVIDELSAPLLPLSALLYLMTIFSTLPTKIGRFSFGMTLFSEAISLATLSCHSPWIIIALLALRCLPPWLELRRRGASTRVFSLHMGLYIVLLVLGWSLIDDTAGPKSAGLLPAALLTIAVLLRAGVVPVHCWMTDLFEHASFGTAILFVAPMTGAYAVMHLVLPFGPSWAMRSIAILSLVTAVYAAGMATVQTDARRFFCYLFLSHASLVLSGLEIVSTIGLTGALCVWISVGISLGGFALTLRSVEARIGRVTLDRYHGMYEHTPTLAGLFLLTGLASIGFPGTIGFVGMELLIEGAVGVFPFVGLAVVLAATLNGIAIMRAYFRIFTGRRFQTTAVLRSHPSERFAVLVMTLLVLGGGLWPQPEVASRHHAAQALLRLRANPEEVIEPDDAPEDEPEMSPSDGADQGQVPEDGENKGLPDPNDGAGNSEAPDAGVFYWPADHVRGDLAA
ncbi:MAG TPA: proton-conducting transporter membrane subunit [Planctomycetaceae bacterium]|nr:proton-conducting transporter membrane subunit [Planctomycetaceae bacterium]